MKVLHIPAYFSYGGIAAVVRSLAYLNKDSGSKHDVLFFLGRTQTDPGNIFALFDLSSDFNYPFRFILKLRRICHDYDVICVHKPHPWVIFPLITLRRKIFLFQHGFNLAKGNRIKRLVQVVWYSLLPFLIPSETICSTRFAYMKMRRSGIRIPEKKVRFIPFGISTRRSDILINPAVDRIRIGTAAALVPIKRIALLIESLRDYDGDLSLDLSVAGDGPLRRELEKQAREVVNGRVSIRFEGYIGNLEDFYDRIDLFVFPSHNESLGLVVFEALFRNRPFLVMSDLGGALEYLPREMGYILGDGPEGMKKFWKTLDCEDLVRKSILIRDADLDRFRIENTRIRLYSLFEPELK